MQEWGDEMDAWKRINFFETLATAILFPLAIAGAICAVVLIAVLFSLAMYVAFFRMLFELAREFLTKSGASQRAKEAEDGGPALPRSQGLALPEDHKPLPETVRIKSGRWLQ
jgi:hypothetical protein